MPRPSNPRLRRYKADRDWRANKLPMKNVRDRIVVMGANARDATHRVQREHEGCALSHFRLWSLHRAQAVLAGPRER
jgi:hypothetical protein